MHGPITFRFWKCTRRTSAGFAIIACLKCGTHWIGVCDESSHLTILVLMPGRCCRRFEEIGPGLGGFLSLVCR